MKLSIIVPVYNVEKYLAQCLDSLVHQTVKDYEVIIVNDGSPDNSQSIIDDYAARYPGLIVPMMKENGGQSSARNLGMTVAKGEFIGFVDSDDWVDETMYERMLEAIERENADIAYCDMDDYYEDGTVVYHDVTNFTDPLTVTCSACNKLFRRNFIEDAQFPVGLWYEDFSFVAKLLFRTNRIVVIHEAFYHCHCRAGSTMNNYTSRKNLDIITVIDDLEKTAQQFGKEDKIEYLVLSHILLTGINRVAAGEKSADRTELIKTMREYAQKKLPKLTQSESFRSESTKRRVIMFLNYHGLESVSQFVLKTKARMK